MLFSASTKILKSRDEFGQEDNLEKDINARFKK